MAASTNELNAGLAADRGPSGAGDLRSTPPQMTDIMTTDASDQPLEMTQSIFEPPRGILLTAISHNKLMVVVFAIVFAIIGLGVGIARKPTYTAVTTLQVGTVNLNSPSFDGFVDGASEFATVFSRSIFAAPVLAELRSKLGVTPSEAAQRLSAEPIPLTPSFRIFATAATPNGAVALANTTSDAVIAYEQRAASATSPQASILLKEYVVAAQTLQRAAALVGRLSAEQARSRVATLRTGITPSRAPSNGLVQARAAEDAARVQAQAIDSAYRSVTIAAAGANPASGLVSLVAAATTATNNRSSRTKLLGLIGLLAGIVIGCAAALIREQRHRSSRRVVAETGTVAQGSSART